MTDRSRGPVVIDTGVFSARLGRRESLLAATYRTALEGRPALISFVTAAEIRYGATLAGWGASRLRRLDTEFARAEIVWPGPDLVDHYVRLRTWCTQHGHGLAHKHHETDRWIAATALRLKVPLVSHDAIFTGIVGLTVITKL